LFDHILITENVIYVIKFMTVLLAAVVVF